MLPPEILIRFAAKTLTVLARVEIDVAVSERAAADGVPADAHGRDGRDLAEEFDEQRLVHARSQIADVQRRHGRDGG